MISCRKTASTSSISASWFLDHPAFNYYPQSQPNQDLNTHWWHPVTNTISTIFLTTFKYFPTAYQFDEFDMDLNETHKAFYVVAYKYFYCEWVSSVDILFSRFMAYDFYHSFHFHFRLCDVIKIRTSCSWRRIFCTSHSCKLSSLTYIQKQPFPDSMRDAHWTGKWILCKSIE